MINDSEVVQHAPFQHYIDSFLEHLKISGYVPYSVAVKRSIVMASARWSQDEPIGSDDLSEEHLAAFVKRRPPRYTSAVEMRALRQFLGHLRVRDRGLGIPAAEQKKIFNKSVRGSGARTARIPGTGIGLAMARTIVAAHGGEIRLDSEPGRGSTFTILLPLENAP